LYFAGEQHKMLSLDACKGEELEATAIKIKMQKSEIEIFYPASQIMWRKWLQENHISKQAVWLDG
jgi:hypothetical protein